MEIFSESEDHFSIISLCLGGGLEGEVKTEVFSLSEDIEDPRVKNTAVTKQPELATALHRIHQQYKKVVGEIVEII